ncbi:protein mono-ADP-ribosyltransferase PARP14-like isoform X2 [Astyanax mexicanus]|uniref:protein mono-ADP-ribosyltransferase PARP14-like isoform X2 n=1 Tax=Astyanax mexicanus TaxID=7994 RepID=UPI0020CB6015|nr:protein mono-ADP-ribosyltransferase PARP14-like isoform X2 [Astyanax mexicanus]
METAKRKQSQDEKTLELEGLPDDFHRVKSKLELYFKNKRRSGGEILEIQEHPEDQRKARLIYMDEGELNKVLEKRVHQVAFKGRGLVDVTVKRLEDESSALKKMKPPILPKPKLEKLELSKSAQAADVQESVSEIPEEAEESSSKQDLLVSTTDMNDKDTLEIYFEQFTEKADLTKHGKNSWILKVASQSDVERILVQKEHDFGLSVEVYKEQSISEFCDPRRFILTGCSGKYKCKYIEMFISSCCQKAEHSWELVDEDRIVVTFKENIDAKTFLTKCTTKKWKDMDLGAAQLELTDSVLVQGDMSRIKEEFLTLYFSNNKRSGGGDIKSVTWVNKLKSVVISFEDCRVAQHVVERTHHISDTDLSAMLFYPSLQKALRGKSPDLSEITTKFSFPVCKEVLGFIETNEKHKNEFQDQLKKVHANLVFDKIPSTQEIKLEMDVDMESLAVLHLGPAWEGTARRQADAFLMKYSTAELAAEVELWKRIKEDCHQLISSDVDISFEETKGRIVLVGLKEVVSTLSTKVQNLLKEAATELEVEMNTVDRVIQLNSKEVFELVAERVHSKISSEVFSTDESSLTFRLKGLKDVVSADEKVINLVKHSIVLHDLRFSPHLLQFLKSLDLKKFEQDHFASSHIAAYFQRDGDHLGILVETENITKAEDKLKELLKEEVIHVTSDLTAVKTSENWLNFLKTLEAEVKFSHNAHRVTITPSEKEIVICGFAPVVADLSHKVRDYLENKTPETAEIQLKSLRELEFVDSCVNLSEVPEIRDLGVTVLACRTDVTPCLKVTAAKENIQDAKSVVMKHVSSIAVETLAYSKAGESKVIHKHEANVKAKAKEWNCQAYLSIEKASSTTPTKSYTHKISNCLSLTIADGDLLKHTAEAYVCPMNSKLIFDNPVAQKFLQVAGPQIQAICSKVQKEKQSLLAGDTVISETGLLNAKTLIYAVLPQSDQSLSTCYMESAIHDSLQKAETSKSASVAMPVIGCGPFGFSVKDSCMAIRKAILKFSSCHQHSPSSIKDILVVDSNPDVVEEFNNLISQLGFPNVSASTSFAKTTSMSPLKPVKPKPGSDTEVTVHGVLVSLKKGDITKETVDVIVNSNNSALDLNTGVSGAILAAAGQSVVDECKKHGPQKADGVVLTGGGNLSCKHIAQMVGPNNAADITLSIEKVLKLCEGQTAATVAIPAIGTGRGGIGTKDSIKAIITGLENHMAQVQTSCLNEITVVAFEQKVYDSYCDYFKERNKKPSLIVAQTAHTKMPDNQVKVAGVRIEVKKGNITNETVRGIVNTTNNQMNLTSGVSGAIFKAAGPSVQQECQNHGPLQSDTVAVTSAGNMQCDFIIHMMGPHSAAEAQLRVRKVLERCEEKQISTVSFPAVGTGGGGVKGAEAITAILQGFEDHLSQRTSTAIKLIYVVVDRDEVLNEFLQGLKQWTSKTKIEMDSDEESEGSVCGDDSDEWEDEESLIASGEDEEYEEEEEEEEEEEDDHISGTTTEAIIGRIKVKVICGDITKDTTEAIVSSTNTNLNLSSGVSGAILKAAGQTVVDECKKLGPQPSDGVVLTKAGNLPFKNIVHMVGQTSEKEITRCMYNVLKKCEENKIQSVSFPALGTGAGNLAAGQVAKAMLDSVANFAIDSPAFLKTVHIVIFQAKMLPDFEGALKTFKKISPKPSPVSKPKPVKQTLPVTKPSKAPLCLSTETAGVTFPVMKVEVYGTSRADLAKVKTFLDNLVNEECITTDISSEHLPSLPEADKETIVSLSQSNEVQVHVLAVDKLTVSGKKDDVYEAVLKINSFLQAAKERELLKVEEKRLSKTLRWEVADREKWVPLDSSISYQLELAFYRKDQNYSYQEKGETYTVDFKDLKRVNSKGQSCNVKRTLLGDAETAIIHPPPTWTKMGGKDLEIVALSKSDEYKKIEQDFINCSKHADVAPVQVVEIHRIQNKGLWQRYCVLKQEVDKKYPKQTNERVLYHGTTLEICQKINKNGFNRSFCGRNAVVHGEGTYFAKDAWYSCQDQYSNPDPNGLKYIYRARVVTGSPCKSRKGMKEPDPLDPNNHQAGLHNCAVDNLQNPFIFVVFCDAGAYPDYLITFKSV